VVIVEWIIVQDQGQLELLYGELERLVAMLQFEVLRTALEHGEWSLEAGLKVTRGVHRVVRRRG